MHDQANGHLCAVWNTTECYWNLMSCTIVLHIVTAIIYCVGLGELHVMIS